LLPDVESDIAGRNCAAVSTCHSALALLVVWVLTGLAILGVPVIVGDTGGTQERFCTGLSTLTQTFEASVNTGNEAVREDKIGFAVSVTTPVNVDVY